MNAKRSIGVGVFLIGGLVLFGVGLFMIGRQSNLFAHTFKVYAWFSKMGGLTVDAQAHLSGFDAGTVSEILIPRQPDGKFRVTLKIDEKFRPLIRESSVASIQSQGMVGDQFVEVDPGDPAAAVCKKDCTIQSKETTSMSDLVQEGKGVMDAMQSTLHKAGDVAQNANDALSTFNARGKAGESGAEGMKQTVLDAQRAANNVAEDADALKHNFFLRGFFKRRGFYDLGEMTADQYRKSDFVKEKKSARVWLPAAELFSNSHGREELTTEGRRQLDNAMSQFVSYLPNKPVMVEGYSSHGAPSEEYLKSDQRASIVREYLIDRFQLKPQNTGLMPLSDSPPEKTGKESWDGISLVVLT
ncbi:MAG TPA: MlaD family protein [Bryobacteraceae bacterium]|nr:MlaD family protein [Bryobacteraceae bacterium]